MATSTLEDQALLQQLFEAPYSPLKRYGEGLLAIATQKKAREQQLQDQARQEQFTLQRDANQEEAQIRRDRTAQEIQAQRDLQYQKFQERLTKSAQDAADKRQREAWYHADKTKKEDILLGLEAEATKLGLTLPTKDLPFDERFQALNGLVNQEKSKSVTSLMQMIGQTEGEISQATGSDPKERAALATQLLFSPRNSDITKVMTPGERQEVLANPEAMNKVYQRLSRDTSKAGKKAFNELFDAHQEAKSIADEEYLKRAGSRVETTALRGKLDQQRLLLANTLRDTVLPASAIIDMFNGMADTAKSIKAEQQATASKALPLPKPIGTPGAGAPTYDPATGALVPRTPATGYPLRANPYQVISEAIRGELAAAPPGGIIGRGAGASATPVMDQFGEVLGNRIGLPTTNVGSSVFQRPRILDILGNPETQARVNAIPSNETDSLALKAITQSVAAMSPSNPTRARLAAFLQDTAAASAAPTAYPAAPNLFSNPLFSKPFSPGLNF